MTVLPHVGEANVIPKKRFELAASESEVSEGVQPHKTLPWPHFGGVRYPAPWLRSHDLWSGLLTLLIRSRAVGSLHGVVACESDTRTGS